MRSACVILAGAAGATAADAARRLAIPSRPTRGAQGTARARAMQRSPLWRATEPAVRTAASMVGGLLPIDSGRAFAMQLRHAGHPLGLTARELFALCLGAGIAGGWLCALVAATLARPPLLAPVAAPLFALAPAMVVRDIAGQRTRDIERHLPAVLDLAALAMDAGIDFAGAIREVCARAAGRGPLLDELGQLIEALRLGQTRREALEAMALNVPSMAVGRFVRAVVQAEERGSPLSSVLRIQATELRRQRSVVAEEAATRAALWLMLPMMLLLGCILLMLIGPFLVSGAGGLS